MESIIKNWNVIRVVRLWMGGMITYQGIQTADWLLGALGGVFIVLPLLSIGTCGVGGCTIKQPATKSSVQHEK